jgi:mannose-1-phosphate guanylyltransferase/mannose-6-phosphate isomerase
MTQKHVIPVVLSGGSGTRLWPLSRAGFPKQFLSLTGDETLFQQALLRLDGLGADDIVVGSPLVVCADDHRFLAVEQLRETGIAIGQSILEPAPRNTAPALTLAALQAIEHDADAILVVSPADQTVTDRSAFTTALQAAIRQAADNQVVILGICPDRAETGYGYIKTACQTVAAGEAVPVARFVEKPDAATAERFLVEGGYFWNAGLFVLKASLWLEALRSFRPDIYETTVAAWQARTVDGTFVRPGKSQFMDIPSDSVDYAVMQRCPESQFPIRMVPLDAGWSDLGAWDAVWNVVPKDANQNACQGDVITIDSRNNLVHATSRLVSLVNVEDLVVVETPDAVLVASKSNSQQVKQVVNALGKGQREEHALHRKVHRPWGWYDSIDEGGRFKVKRIQVKPKASLSLQMHHHRAEHWIVVAGTAEVTNGDRKIILSENQSTYIPLGETHRLANPGTIPLEIIEVQSGSYLGEDDIVRFEDHYGRDKQG